jgi:hypothetical protein
MSTDSADDFVMVPLDWSRVAQKLGPIERKERCRILRTTQQTGTRKHEEKKEAEQGLVEIRWEDLCRRLVGVGPFLVFGDLCTWKGPFNYLQDAETLQDLRDLGDSEGFLWWHGYDQQRDLVVEFEYDKKIVCRYRYKMPSQYLQQIKLYL